MIMLRTPRSHCGENFKMLKNDGWFYAASGLRRFRLRPITSGDPALCAWRLIAEAKLGNGWAHSYSRLATTEEIDMWDALNRLRQGQKSTTKGE